MAMFALGVLVGILCSLLCSILYTIHNNVLERIEAEARKRREQKQHRQGV